MASTTASSSSSSSKSGSSSSVNLFFLLFTLASSFFFGTWLNPQVAFTKKDLLRGLENVTLTAKDDSGAVDGKRKHLLIGFNANLDSVVHDGAAFLKSLPGVDENASPSDVKVVNSAKEFGQVFAHHFASSSAGERAIGNDTLWSLILTHLANFNVDDNDKLGGNAALMAEAVGKGFPNVDLTLLGMAGPRIAGKLQSRIKIVNGGSERTIAVGSEKFPARFDQVHLILEYPVDSKFGSLKASRANRFIVSRDFSNGAMASLDSLYTVRYENADVLVVAGVHIMDGMLSKELRTTRLRELQSSLERYFPSTRIHFELGSAGDSDFIKEMVTTIQADSIGLNEQEFFAVCESLGICKQEDKQTMASAVPPVVKVQETITTVFERLPRLSRIHFHCFAYHLIAHRKASEAKWPNPRQAVAAGSTIATTRACMSRISELHGNKLTLSVASVKVLDDKKAVPLIIELTAENPIAEFSHKGISFYLAPVVACTVPKQTVGLGDYISAYALSMQL